MLTGFCVVFYWWVFGCFVFFTAFESAIRYCVSLAEGSAKAATFYAQMTKICTFEQIFFFSNQSVALLILTSRLPRVMAGTKTARCCPWVRLSHRCRVSIIRPRRFFFGFKVMWVFCQKKWGAGVSQQATSNTDGFSFASQPCKETTKRMTHHRQICRKFEEKLY